MAIKKHYQKKVKNILEKLKKETKEIEELIPDNYMTYTNSKSREVFVSYEYHKILKKLLVKERDTYGKAISELLNILKKLQDDN